VVVPASVVTGAPAIIIILVILALLLLGIVSFFRMTARGAKRLAGHSEHNQREHDTTAAGRAG
jgi:flagellar basal body-associated protein FliL